MKNKLPISPLNKHRLEICFIIILLFTVLLKLPSLKVPHQEYDERIYVALAKQLYNTGTYTLRNTPILKELAPEMYDRPLFYQPPLFIILSIPLVLNCGDNSAVIISWAGHLLVLLSIFLFCRKILMENHLAILMIIVLAATDPIMIFASRKIWIDSLVAGLAGISMFVFWKACLEEVYKLKIRYFTVSGILLGAAILTKVPALLLGPFYALIYFKYHYSLPIKKSIILLVAFFIPPLVMTFPWFLLTYIHFGKLIDTPILPEKLIQTNRYIGMVIKRPPYYYIKEIVLISPIILLTFFYSLRHVKRISFFALTIWVSLFSVIGGYTYFAVAYHQAYVMRYLTLICIPFYVLLGIYLENRLQNTNQSPSRDLIPNSNIFDYTILFLALIVNSMTSLFLIVYSSDILFSLYEILKSIQ